MNEDEKRHRQQMDAEAARQAKAARDLEYREKTLEENRHNLEKERAPGKRSRESRTPRTLL